MLQVNDRIATGYEGGGAVPGRDAVGVQGYAGRGLHEGWFFLETNTSKPGGSVYENVPAALSRGHSYMFSVRWRALDVPEGVSGPVWESGQQFGTLLSTNGVPCSGPDVAPLL